MENPGSPRVELPVGDEDAPPKKRESRVKIRAGRLKERKPSSSKKMCGNIGRKSKSKEDSRSRSNTPSYIERKHISDGRVVKIDFNCKNCEEAFSTKEGLRRHTISADREVQLNECSHCVQSQPQRRKSARRKSGAEKCKCDYCRRLFTSNSVKFAKDIEAPTTCYICRKSFATMATLMTHVGKMHNKPYGMCVTCAQCRKQFKSKTGLVQHMKEAHPKIEYMCGYCYKPYVSIQRLQKHISDTHNDYNGITDT